MITLKCWRAFRIIRFRSFSFLVIVRRKVDDTWNDSDVQFRGAIYLEMTPCHSERETG